MIKVMSLTIIYLLLECEYSVEIYVKVLWFFGMCIYVHMEC